MNKKKAGIVLGAILLAVAAAAGIWYYTENVMKDSNDRVYVEKVSTIMGTNTGVWNRYAGVVEPQKSVEVNADADREVSEVLVKVGDKVKKGQPLFHYDAEEQALEWEQAKLEVENFDIEISGFKKQITELENEKKTASETEKFEYTTQIQKLEMEIKQTEYDKASKEVEVEKLRKKVEASEVLSPASGIVKTINDSSGGYEDMGSSSAFMTILSTGEYKVKGTINEQNIEMIYADAPVIVRSRVDEEQIWHGTIEKIDTGAPEESAQDEYMDYEGEGAATSSSNYPFYVALEDADGLMLGQHVLIELDEGQTEEKEGVWLYGSYIVTEDNTSLGMSGADFITADIITADVERAAAEFIEDTEFMESTESAGNEKYYVWADDGNGRLEKREVILGEYDAGLDQYEIKSGLTEDDKIAWPMEGLYEGIITVTDMEDIDYTSDLYNLGGTENLGETEFLEDEYWEDTEYLEDEYWNEEEGYWEDEENWEEDEENWEDENWDEEENREDEVEASETTETSSETEEATEKDTEEVELNLDEPYEVHYVLDAEVSE